MRTSVLTPSQVERNRVTSFMHSLKPARYLPSTVGSVLSAAAGGERRTAVSRLCRGWERAAYWCWVLQPLRAGNPGPSGSVSCAPGCQGSGRRARPLWHQEPRWGTDNPRSPPVPLSTGDPGWEHSPPGSSRASRPPKREAGGEYSSASREDPSQDRSPPSALQYQGCRWRAQCPPQPPCAGDTGTEQGAPHRPPPPTPSTRDAGVEPGAPVILTTEDAGRECDSPPQPRFPPRGTHRSSGLAGGSAGA